MDCQFTSVLAKLSSIDALSSAKLEGSQADQEEHIRDYMLEQYTIFKALIATVFRHGPRDMFVLLVLRPSVPCKKRTLSQQFGIEAIFSGTE